MNIVESYAHRYAELGWSVIPITAHEKTPAVASWRKFQQIRPTAEQIRSWKWANVAVVTGGVSGVCVVDEDDLSALSSDDQTLAQAFIDSLPETATARTGKGRHYYFRIPDGELVPSKVRFLPGIDARAAGGYALAPPSIHPSGAIYTWEEGHTPEDGIAELPGEVLTVLRGSTGIAETGGERSSWRTALSGVKEGEGRNNAATKVAGILLSTMPQELWDGAWEALRSWNQRNVPPLSERELRTTFESIKSRELSAKAKAAAADMDIITLEELLAKDIPPIQPIIGDVLVPGVTMLVGKPKLGKSRLALQLSLCVATGRRPFDKLPSVAHGISGDVTPGHVLYLALEDSPSRYKSRALTMLRGLEPPPPGAFRLTTSCPSLFNGGIQRIERELKNDPYLRLVVVDTLAAFVGSGSQSSNGSLFQAEYRMIRPLFDLVNGTEVCLLLVHHARKDQSFASDPFDSVAGTLGTHAAVDSIMILYHPRKRPVTLAGRGRDIEGFELPLADDGLAWKIAQEEQDA